MRTVHVQFFAVFREQAGCAETTVTTEARDARSLFAQLRETHPGLADFAGMKFAVNDEICGPDQALQDGDRVLFFPPVAGG